MENINDKLPNKEEIQQWKDLFKQQAQDAMDEAAKKGNKLDIDLSIIDNLDMQNIQSVMEFQSKLMNGIMNHPEKKKTTLDNIRFIASLIFSIYNWIWLAFMFSTIIIAIVVMLIQGKTKNKGMFMLEVQKLIGSFVMKAPYKQIKTVIVTGISTFLYYKWFFL